MKLSDMDRYLGFLVDPDISEHVREMADFVFGERLSINQIEAVIISLDIIPGGARTMKHNDTLSDHEADLIKGLIDTQLYHAARCDMIANQKMARKQKTRDMEKVEVLKKILRVMANSTGDK